jgi:hypothetical protein
MENNIQEKFRITPKGYLAVLIGKYTGASPLVTVYIWNDMAKYVKETAVKRGIGSKDGIPVLIMTDSGDVATAERNS